MLRLIVIGAAGRMGRRVVRLSEQLDDVEVVGAIIRAEDPRIGDDAGLVAGTNVLGVPLGSDLPGEDAEADVAIDFSSPEGTRRFVVACVERGLPIVIGTTGLGARARALIVEASRKVPIMVAPNLSIGVALLTRLAAEAAAALGLGADVEIVEAHHRHKRDPASGTALHLAKAVAEARGQRLDEVLVTGATAPRTGLAPQDARIAVHALRTGDVTGEHTLTFGFGSERIELTHRTHSRDVFARGAVRAALFLRQAAPGLYGPGDLVGAAGGGLRT